MQGPVYGRVQGKQGLAFPGVSMPSWQRVGEQGKEHDKEAGSG